VRKCSPDNLQIAILPQFLAIKPHFVRKGCAGQEKLEFYLSFWRSNLISCEKVAPDKRNRNFTSVFAELHFVRKGCDWTPEIAILPQFLAIEPHFVRKGCVSRRLAGTAPRLQERNRKEGESKRARRGQESKRAREQEGKRECEDVKMRRCQDVRM